MTSFGPWYVWDFGQQGGKHRYLLFEADKFLMHPGRTRISMTVLEDSGEIVSETHLTTGWRCYLRAATIETAIKSEHPLVVLSTGLGPSSAGPDVQKQYYAWIDNRFDLVRLEDSAGKATRNRYYIKHFKCGPYRTERTESEWIADITSADRLRVLRALVWLGGIHWDLTLTADGTDGKQNEDVDQVHLVWRVRANAQVIAVIRDLALSEDPWLREAALLAAHPEDDHF